MQSFRHPLVTTYIDSFVRGSRLYLVMEYCQKGDLEGYLSRMNMSSVVRVTTAESCGADMAMQLSEMRIWKLFIQLCVSLEYIHKKGVVHADLKPSNILLQGRDYDVKLTDFGVSILV